MAMTLGTGNSAVKESMALLGRPAGPSRAPLSAFSDEKKAKLARMSYASFLKDVAGVHEDIVKLYQALPHGLFGVGIDAVSAQDAWGLDLPGFDGMKLDPTPGKGMNRDAIPNERRRNTFSTFPTGMRPLPASWYAG